MQKKGQYFSKKLTVEVLERLWALEDLHSDDLKESLDEALETMKEKNKPHQDIDELIKNHDRVKELQQRERKQMLWKIKVKNKQRMEKKKKKDKKREDQGVSSDLKESLDEALKTMKERNKTLEDGEKKQMLRKITIKNIERMEKKKKKEEEREMEREDKASHENEGVDPSAASVVETAMESSKKKGRLANEPKSLNIDEDDSVKTTSQEIMEKDITKDMALPVVMGFQCNEMTVTQGKIIQKSSTEISPSVAEGDTNQLDVLSAASTVVFKEGKEEDAATVAPKRKRGRQPTLQPKSPETPVTVEYNQNGGVGPAEISVVEGAQVTEVSSPTSPGIKLVEKSQEPVKEPNENPIKEPNEISVKEPNENPEQDASAQRGKKKYSSAKGRQGKQRTISVNESLAQGADIPFVKTTPLWHTIESMEAFRKLPQNPHFRPLLKGVKESAREGLAIGTMVTFSTVVDRTYCLRFDDPRSAIEDSLKTLVDLESNGFDVEAIRERLTRLLLIKDKQEELEDRSKVFVEKIEEQKIQEKTFDDELDEIDRQIRQLEEKRSKVLLKKEKWSLEVGALKAAEEAIEQELLEVAAEFDGLAAAPF